MKRIFIILSILLSGIVYRLHAQVIAEVSIENQTLSGTEVTFDVYIKTLSGTSGDLYLGNGDFVFSYNTANFTNPTFSKEGTGVGFVTFVPTDPDGLIPGFNTLSTQSTYFNNTSTSITDGQLIISLNGPTPSDQSAFDGSVARIDGSTSTHRLGRFKLTGVTNPNGTFGLIWKGDGAGFITKVFTLGETGSYISTRINTGDLTLSNGLDIALPVEILNFQVQKEEDDAFIIWETATEIESQYFEIQHSKNGIDWEELGQIQAKGGPSYGSKYEYKHERLDQGVHYYRLRIVDEDQSFEFSEIRSIKHLTDALDANIEVFPNPTTDLIFLELAEELNSDLSYSIFNSAGQLVRSGIISNAITQFNVTSLPAGTYMIHLHELNESLTFLKN